MVQEDEVLPEEEGLELSPGAKQELFGYGVRGICS